MSTICFITYEIHPTNRGGCGVLLHHAAEILLQRGHDVVFLLAMPRHEFEQFRDRDRLAFPNPDHCRAYHLDELCADFPLRPDAFPTQPPWYAARFAHAWSRLSTLERIDFAEFFEYCGVSYYALTRRLFGREPDQPNRPILGSRLHGAIELLDRVGSTRYLDLARYHLYALEHAALRLSEAVLTPTQTYFDEYHRDAYALSPAKAVVSQSPKLPFPRVRRRPDPAREPFTIAYIGRMFSFKGIDQLVRAGVELLSRRPSLNCTIDIIGPDANESPLGHSYIEYLKTLIPAHLHPRFNFTGHLSHVQFSARLDSALFAVFPNQFESFCYAAHEVYDAGVPCILNDIAAWRDFFTHERNALVYDGRTDTLVAAMERLLDEPALRESLCRPYPIADNPLGTFYEAPRALEPIARPNPALPRVLCIVLCDALDPATTLRTLAAQQHAPAKTIVLRPSSAESADGTDAPPLRSESFWFLGKQWHVTDERGVPLAPDEIPTLDAILVLRAGDLPAPAFLRACATALANRPDLGFAGTWARRDGTTLPSTLDLAPEAYPIEQGATPTRTLVRTHPDRLLVDLFDPALAALAEIGVLWRAVDSFGPGAMLSEPLLDLAPDTPAPIDPSLLKHLLHKYSGPFAPRLALYCGLMHDRVEALSSRLRRSAAPSNADAPLPEPRISDPSLDHKIAMADELGTRTLARLTFRKISRKLRSKLSGR